MNYLISHLSVVNRTHFFNAEMQRRRDQAQNIKRIQKFTTSTSLLFPNDLAKMVPRATTDLCASASLRQKLAPHYTFSIIDKLELPLC